MKNVNIKNLSGQCTKNIVLHKIYNRCPYSKLNQRVEIMEVRSIFVLYYMGD